MDEPMGARERGKQERRARILEAARARFAAQGYAGTTCEEVARDAGVSPRTFYAYFPTKDDLLFADDEADLAHLTSRLAGRAPGTSALDVLREVVDGWTSDPSTESELLRVRLIAQDPALAAREGVHLARFRDVIAAAVAADLGLPEDDVRGEVVAAALTAAWSMALARLLDGRLRAEDVPTLLDDTFAFARTGLAALTGQRRPTGRSATRW